LGRLASGAAIHDAVDGLAGGLVDVWSVRAVDVGS
jgi:hypothetical protein